MTLDAQMNDGLMTPKDCKITSESCYNSKTVAATARGLRLRYKFMQKQNWSVCVYGFMWVRGGEGEDPWLARDVRRCPC